MKVLISILGKRFPDCQEVTWRVVDAPSRPVSTRIPSRRSHGSMRKHYIQRDAQRCREYPALLARCGENGDLNREHVYKRNFFAHGGFVGAP